MFDGPGMSFVEVIVWPQASQMCCDIDVHVSLLESRVQIYGPLLASQSLRISTQKSTWIVAEKNRNRPPFSSVPEYLAHQWCKKVEGNNIFNIIQNWSKILYFNCRWMIQSLNIGFVSEKIIVFLNRPYKHYW